MVFDDMVAAVQDAQLAIRRADRVTKQIAELIAGRLKVGQVGADTLTELKKELRDFNIHTGRWK